MDLLCYAIVLKSAGVLGVSLSEHCFLCLCGEEDTQKKSKKQREDKRETHIVPKSKPFGDDTLQQDTAEKDHTALPTNRGLG